MVRRDLFWWCIAFLVAILPSTLYWCFSNKKTDGYADRVYAPPILSTVYTGKEHNPITLRDNFPISKEKLMFGVNKRTALIIVRNQSGKDFSFFQLDISSPKSIKDMDWYGYYLGRGRLLKNQKRVIKATIAGDRWDNPRLIWKPSKNSSWYSSQSFAGGIPVVFTVLKDDKVVVKVGYPD